MGWEFRWKNTGIREGQDEQLQKLLQVWSECVVHDFRSDRHPSHLGCFSRNVVDHIAGDCPSEHRLCYNCNKPGHEVNDCPEPHTVDGKTCFTCGGKGHVRARCPNNRGGRSYAGASCYVSIIEKLFFRFLTYPGVGNFTRRAEGLDILRATAGRVLALFTVVSPRPLL